VPKRQREQAKAGKREAKVLARAERRAAAADAASRLAQRSPDLVPCSTNGCTALMDPDQVRVTYCGSCRTRGLAP
jgi:hypothetical protein